ncbi:hypothetical protein [Streptomyces sp. UNOB3_S3]|uniref:hypothetical protein n=1 Tax=Streptomyces sp. UNOB3_S3 TaxID=2871682 RepID=UPI001E54D350|nr:hypothetical protein [Streptomyces sp. UNOB3_S3]MCC3775421.1 hypothetical protein [Streptomyces sp. UNOB3_S3]
MDGRLEVFVVATDRSLWVTEQQKHNEDVFTQVQQLDGYVSGHPAPANYVGNRILVPHRGRHNDWWGFQQRSWPSISASRWTDMCPVVIR